MGLSSWAAPRVARNYGKAVHRVVRGALEPGEVVEAWFAGMMPGDMAGKVSDAQRTAARMAGTQGFIQGLVAGRLLPDGQELTFTPSRETWVLTDRRIHRLEQRVVDGRPKRTVGVIGIDEVLGLDRQGRLGSAAGSALGRAYAVLATGEALEFELWAFGIAPFDDFVARLEERRGPLPTGFGG